MNYVLNIIVLIVFIIKINCVYLSPIVGGYAPAAHDDFSFAVSLQVKNSTETAPHPEYKHFCGGTYLRNGWILTASHCIVQLDLIKSEVFAVIGERNLREVRSPLYKVLKIIAKKYDRFTYQDDIALVKIDTTDHGEPNIKTKVVISNVPLMDYIKPTDQCYLFGYGSTEYLGEATMELQIGPSHIISQEKCVKNLGKFMAPEPNSKMFCAEGIGRNGQVDACQGDSGGSIICRKYSKNIAIGITSYGAGCGVPGMPGVYTSIPDHAKWINEITVQP